MFVVGDCKCNGEDRHQTEDGDESQLHGFQLLPPLERDDGLQGDYHQYQDDPDGKDGGDGDDNFKCSVSGGGVNFTPFSQDSPLSSRNSISKNEVFSNRLISLLVYTNRSADARICVSAVERALARFCGPLNCCS